jgi:hypothetical protein
MWINGDNGEAKTMKPNKLSFTFLLGKKILHMLPNNSPNLARDPSTTTGGFFSLAQSCKKSAQPTKRAPNSVYEMNSINAFLK